MISILVIMEEQLKNGDYVGGIVGINNGKIYSCYNTGDVMDRGNTTIGGIVGELFEEGRTRTVSI